LQRIFRICLLKTQRTAQDILLGSRHLRMSVCLSHSGW